MASFMYVGKDKKQADSVKKFGADYLKLDMIVLNERSLSDHLPKFDSHTIIFIENGCTLGSKHEEFVTAIKAKDVTLLFKDSNAAAMRGYAAVCPDAPYVVVQNSCNGRNQRVIVIGLDMKIEADVKKHVRQRTSKDVEKLPKLSPSDLASVKRRTSSKDEGLAVADEPSEDVLALLADCLRDDRFVRLSNAEDKQVHYWQHDTQVVLASIDAIPSSPSFAKKGKVKSFYSLLVQMYAVKLPTKYKYIRFKQTDSCGMTVQMGLDNDSDRGYFNNNGETYLYPGSGKDPFDSDVLPSGWFRPYSEPHTPNSQTSYTSTTGWSVGVTGGGNADGPSANVTASYSQSDAVTTTINDFSVRNKSDGTMSGWQFYYTCMDGDGWQDHNHYVAFWGYAIDSIADLAKSTLFYNAEAVYQGPPDYSDMMSWSAVLNPTWSLLDSDGDVFTECIILCIRFIPTFTALCLLIWELCIAPNNMSLTSRAG